MKPNRTPLSADNLQWLLAGMAAALAPLAGHLPLWVTLTTAALGAWRLVIARRGMPLPGLWLRLPATFAGFGAILASYHGSLGRDAGVALLVLMLGLKLLEAASRRDGILLVYLTWFLSLCGLLFSQSLLLGAYLLLPVTLLTAALLGLSHAGGRLPAALRLRLGGTLLLQALPFMLALFVLFPRAAGPLWGVPKDALQGITGLSDSMSPGAISELILSDDPVLRAEFEGALPQPGQRYWRGPVFWHYDGRTWRPGTRARNLPAASLTDAGDSIRYTVTQEASNRPWLFLLDLPATAAAGARLSHDYQMLAQQPVTRRVRYQAASHLRYRLDAEPAPLVRELALQLPAHGNPRARQLARQWAAEARDPAEIAERALRLFREQAFVYTLGPPALGTHAVDEFLFDTRRGFCEHYAGSFVFLMRAAGVPARVVTGYQGGTFSPLGRYLLVRQSDAHAWAEIWLPQRGWTRVDPTSAVSPARIESGIGDALPAGEALPMLTRNTYPWLRTAYLWLDALNNGWNQWVLEYNQQRQQELLSWLYGSRITLLQTAQAAIIAALALLLGYAALQLHAARRPAPHRLDRAYARFVRRLARAGIARQPWEGPLDYGRRAAAALPRQAAAISAITGDYAAQRYGGQHTRQRYRALIDNIRNFRP